MLRKVIFIGTTIAAAQFALADTIGFSVGGYSWQQKIDGTVRSGSDAVDLNNDLNLDDDNGNVFFAELDHPIPLIPNVRIQHTALKADQSTTLERTITVDDVTYAAATDINTELDLSHTDATLYYRPLDNWVKLRFGLTVRNFDKGVHIHSPNTGESASVDINTAIPLLYLAARFDLPLTGLYVGADANGIAYSGSHLYDARIHAGYETPIGLGVEGGYRKFQLKYDHSGDHADMTIDGMYAGVFYHF